MNINIIKKPTAHKCDCKICNKPVKKGEVCLHASQITYPGERIGYAHIKCICKKVKEMKK